ncbi:MAG: peptidoglycan DD-metalloendopeptidase family protein [Methylophilaceae bacterium]|nr:peptidoglycan DD-metalloendopeptidase family protein [Methylophilaceae bacterium]
MFRFKFVIVVFLLFTISACTTNPPAPVIERNTKPNSVVKNKAINSDKSKSSPNNKSTNKDWRPDSYTIKKGDTLYSIGLEYGYDYKDIATTNNISAPYNIKVGQQLKFTPPKEEANTGAVVITPMKTDTNVVANNTASNTPKTPITITEPKAKREPYSLDAMNKPVAVAVTIPTEAKSKTDIKLEPKIEVKPDTKQEKPNTSTDDQAEWAWPTKGKITSSFNQVGNKGIDIAGETGQSINAASSGKVIYSGSDLRGYGKLVIIKHSSTFLSVYAHNSKILVKEGQQVSRGQKIAEMGNSDSDKTALHFEIRQQGKSIDPSKFLVQK